MIRLSQRRMSRLFWEIIFETDELISSETKKLFFEQSVALESLRKDAAYNTGSIPISQSYILFLLTLFLKPKRVIEIGTFIGRSTLSIAKAMDQYCEDGEIHTCDFSNDIRLPWDGKARITQYPLTSSGQMLEKLEGPFDLIFLDGRITDLELGRLSELLTENSVVVLDDFEGMEKGVINLIKLRQTIKFQSYFLIYPTEQTQMRNYNFVGNSTAAVLIPTSMFQLSNQ